MHLHRIVLKLPHCKRTITRSLFQQFGLFMTRKHKKHKETILLFLHAHQLTSIFSSGQQIDVLPQESTLKSQNVFAPDILICQYINSAHIYVSWKNRCDGSQ